MTIELVKILEQALETAERSQHFFENYEESTDPIDKNLWYELSAECKGILKAYEIITGKKVYPSIPFIKEELAQA